MGKKDDVSQSAAVCVFNEDGHIVLIENEQWEIPGGKIEKGESPYEAASRELREETGLVVAPSNLLFCGKVRHYSRLTDTERKIWDCHIFSVTEGDKPIYRTLSDDDHEFDWEFFKPTELPRKTWSFSVIGIQLALGELIFANNN